jgi:ribosomal protein L20
MQAMKKAKILLDRKILAELAVSDKKAFGKLVETVKA